ncbi:DUF1192 family protein [Roseicella frigidaeris]|uniref:DUF1192 domain-containing protein n=1 Tax=Roseicella frigidaeris TaxID=2230885 RepID=A0A327LYF3_9PROT|nr:DUF1192 family protein [Roseicella frigidaeris]RAI55941.1 DUF1192 domain-containing protein [Roseicella frigidaeris]
MMEEERPRPTTGFTPAVLEGRDIEELRRYIVTLQAEIARAEAAIARKEAHRGAADAFFRKPGG